MVTGPQGCRRRELLGLILAAMPLPLVACRQQTQARLPTWMMTSGGTADSDLDRDMAVIQELLIHHQDIMRTVEDLSYGIRAATTSANPDVAERIRTHVRQMKTRLQQGARIRDEDPLFAEIFQYSPRIDLQIEYLSHGVRVSESSHDPLTAMLIRQHAHRAVSEFVSAGMDRAVRPTPLPAGYHR